MRNYISNSNNNYDGEVCHNKFNAPSRQLYMEIKWRGVNGTSVFTSTSNIISLSVDNTIPKGKFFGYVVSKKVTLELLGTHKIEKDDILEPRVRTHWYVSETGEEHWRGPYLPMFIVDTVEVDRVANKTRVTGYDFVTRAKNISMADLDFPLEEGETVYNYIQRLNSDYLDEYSFAGWPAAWFHITWDDRTWSRTQALETDPLFSIVLTKDMINATQASTTLYDMLTWIAELTGCFIYSQRQGYMVFQRLEQEYIYGGHDGDKYLALTPQNYFSFTSGAPVTLKHLRLTTPLGDNIETGSPANMTEYVQTIADNPLLVLRDDRAEILTSILGVVEGATILPYHIESRGNLYYDIGDYIAVYQPDGTMTPIYWLNESYTYNGGLRATAFFELEQQEDVHANSINLGEQLKNTVAKVDKVNNEISLVASKADANSEAISAINMNVDSINASVSRVEQATIETVNGITDEIATLTHKVEAVMTPEQVELQIKAAINKGADSVTTSTGFTFNQDGLNISKTGSEMTTNIDEDGMSVFRNNTEVLTADNTGVTAYNLKAKTYLIVGEYSRFEDYTSTTGEARTGCFWIGG